MSRSLALASLAAGLLTPSSVTASRPFASTCTGTGIRPYHHLSSTARRQLLLRHAPSAVGATHLASLSPQASAQGVHATGDGYAAELLDVFARRGGRVGGGSREEHIAAQATFVASALPTLGAALPEESAALVGEALRGVQNLGTHSRVIIVGSVGQQALQVAAAVQAVGVLDVLAVDVCPEALADIPEAESTCGNDLQLRTWVGDIAELPDYLGGADLVVFCGSLGRMHSVRDALLRCSLILKPGGAVAICEPFGYGWQSDAAEAAPGVMPHRVPRGEELRAAVSDLALEVEAEEETERFGFALLRVPHTYGFPAAPLRLAGRVTTGFGRGSRQMGVPTANLPPEPLADQIETLPNGVYFGWAKLMSGTGDDAGVKKMVMNIGERPTCEDGGGRTVEVHVMHDYAADFYGQPLRALVLGYLRAVKFIKLLARRLQLLLPEMRFTGFGPLVARIRTDIGVAKYMLDDPELGGSAGDQFFD